MHVLLSVPGEGQGDVRETQQQGCCKEIEMLIVSRWFPL